MANPFGSMFNGLFGRGEKRRVSPYQEAGTSGTAVYGGYVQSVEINPRLASHEDRYRTWSDILVNTSIVAAGVRYFLGLVAKPEWSVDPVQDLPDGQSSDAAKEAAEFVESVLAGMDTSWRRIIRRSGMYRFYGFAIQEWQAKKRPDGLVGIANIESRPQHTIERWEIDERTGSVLGVWQRSPQTGVEFWIPRWKTVYLVDDTLTDSPEGIGILRQVTEPSARLQAYLSLEGTGYERDLRGTPIGRAPLAELEQAVKAGQITKEDMAQALNGMRKFVEMQAKGSKTGMLLDSQPFKNVTGDGHSWSSAMRWGLDLLQGNSTGIEHLGAAIERENWEMARILGVENLLVGGNSGSRALSEDKSKNLYLQVNSVTGDMAEIFGRDLIGALWTLNGLDDALKPTLTVEDVSFMSVEQVAATLRDMATAGAVLSSDDPAINEVREMMGLSHQPDQDMGI